jgi:hypothetical protein
MVLIITSMVSVLMTDLALAGTLFMLVTGSARPTLLTQVRPSLNTPSMKMASTKCIATIGESSGQVITFTWEAVAVLHSHVIQLALVLARLQALPVQASALKITSTLPRTTIIRYCSPTKPSGTSSWTRALTAISWATLWMSGPLSTISVVKTETTRTSSSKEPLECWPRRPPSDSLRSH